MIEISNKKRQSTLLRMRSLKASAGGKNFRYVSSFVKREPRHF